MQPASGNDPITILNALSTAAVALFAMVELFRNSRDRWDRRKASFAKIEVAAQSLNRKVADWNGVFPVDAIHRSDLTSAQEVRMVRQWLDAMPFAIEQVEGELLRMVELSLTSTMRQRRLVSNLNTRFTIAIAQIQHYRSVVEVGAPVNVLRAAGKALRKDFLDVQAALTKAAHRTFIITR